MKTFREFLEIANIQLDENLRRAEYLAQRGTPKERKKRIIVMDANAKQAKKEASTSNLIRSLRPPEPPTPVRVGNPDAAPPSGESLNLQRKPPRPRVVEPYVPPIDPSTGAPVNLKDRTSKIPPFGIVYEPPAKPVKRKRG